MQFNTSQLPWSNISMARVLPEKQKQTGLSRANLIRNIQNINGKQTYWSVTAESNEWRKSSSLLGQLFNFLFSSAFNIKTHLFSIHICLLGILTNLLHTLSYSLWVLSRKTIIFNCSIDTVLVQWLMLVTKQSIEPCGCTTLLSTLNKILV